MIVECDSMLYTLTWLVVALLSRVFLVNDYNTAVVATTTTIATRKNRDKLYSCCRCQ